VHGDLRSTPNASQLRGALVPSPLGEQRLLRRDCDPGLAQVIGEPEREVDWHTRLGDPDGPRGAQAELVVDLRVREPSRAQLVPAEGVDQQALDVRHGLGDSRFLQGVREDRPAASRLDVEEWVSDRQRKLVAEGRAALGIAEDQHVHRSREVDTARAGAGV